MKRSLQYLTKEEAQHLDMDLMSSKHGFSIDQLMELAGQSVSHIVDKECQQQTNLDKIMPILVVSGPGNNGGDGLVAARHLKHFGWNPHILYPKNNTASLFQNLVCQCRDLEIPFISKLPSIEQIRMDYRMILDAMFGFSFKGNLREPFKEIISTLNQSHVPIISVDIPSGWDVEKGNINNEGIQANVLISLSAPKLCAKYFEGRHYLGGRFIPKSLDIQYSLNLPEYPGIQQYILLK